MTIAQKIRDLRADLVSRFPERQHVVDGSIAALLASEHVLMIGPPGTAKSSLSRAIAQAVSGRYFERLLTRFSVPDEIFGPVSLRALENDRFERVLAGKLPEAEIGFLDEVFRANSSILNSLLTLMNERLFHNDRDVVHCPLVTLFGASNELPDGRELEAVFDRFLLRFDVQYLAQPSALRAVLLAPEPSAVPWMTLDELREAQEMASAVDVPADVVDGVLTIRDALAAEGIVASDRRWKKCLKLVRCSAFSGGETKAQVEDLSIVTDALWREPKERQKVARIVGQIADPTGAQATEILEAARETARKVVEMRAGERSAYVGAAAKAIDQFVEQKNRLTEISRQGGRKARTAVSDAIAEIQGMHAECQRAVAASMGLQAGLRATL